MYTYISRARGRFEREGAQALLTLAERPKEERYSVILIIDGEAREWSRAEWRAACRIYRQRANQLQLDGWQLTEGVPHE